MYDTVHSRGHIQGFLKILHGGHIKGENGGGYPDGVVTLEIFLKFFSRSKIYLSFGTILLKVHKHEKVLNFFVLGQYWTKCWFFSFDFCQNFDVGTFSWLSTQGIYFLLGVILFSHLFTLVLLERFLDGEFRFFIATNSILISTFFGPNGTCCACCHFRAQKVLISGSLFI